LLECISRSAEFGDEAGVRPVHKGGSSLTTGELGKRGAQPPRDAAPGFSEILPTSTATRTRVKGRCEIGLAMRGFDFPDDFLGYFWVVTVHSQTLRFERHL